MHQNVASPIQQTIATPPRIAMNGPTLAHALVGAFSAPQTTPPTLMLSIQPSNICNQLPSFLEFGSLGPELDLMFQAGSMGMFLDWMASTPQWSNNCLESNPFIAAGPTTVNMASQLLASSGMAPTVDYLTLATQAALELPQLSPTRSPQSRNELPLLPPAPSTDPNSPSDVFMECLQSFMYTGPGSSPNRSLLTSITQNFENCEGPALGRARRKPVPSLRVLRDNMIGDMNKENVLPVLAGKKGKKSKGKCSAASEANDGPAKKAKKN
ncbi:hypothetical protein SCLCIDRAFT_30907 [Scleroderma citrinum Foug A]|uniref:Uncharacterized protein n=1 Tax=Scleroderma citrinum Foug A TaxID=1036808 RepID=A0A0C2ZQ18_9AGAM|nr:hypothetical protein SCLCIDRAFT_30907 [Scleroderma citrinum Foug A]